MYRFTYSYCQILKVNTFPVIIIKLDKSCINQHDSLEEKLCTYDDHQDTRSISSANCAHLTRICTFMILCCYTCLAPYYTIGQLNNRDSLYTFLTARVYFSFLHLIILHYLPPTNVISSYYLNAYYANYRLFIITTSKLWSLLLSTELHITKVY